MAVMIEPRKEEEMDPVAAEAPTLDKRISVVEVKLDGLSTKVDEGFKRVDKHFEKIDDRFEKIDDRFDRMYGLMLHTAIALFGTFITGFGILAALIIAQT